MEQATEGKAKDVGPSSGLYVGFEGYRSATEADLVQAVRNWLVVLDTNVLLQLYNYQGSSLDDFIQVFEALGDRLFVPHQVLDEFWRNRRVVLSENQGRHREQENVEKAFDDLESTFRRWHQRVVDRISPPPPDALRELHEARAAVLNYMAKMNAEAVATVPDTPTKEDRVLVKLDLILRDKIGPPPQADRLASLRAEGKERVTSKTPPGYMDGDKNPVRAIGDFLVWRQTMDASKERTLPVLFVTQDQKEDWWVDRGTRSMRARPELVSELLDCSRQRLLMIRAHDLVRLGSHLGVKVRQSTLDEAELASEVIDGWTPELVSAYLEALARWPKHLKILNEAVHNSGQIKRSRMAEILDRDPDVSMSGAGLPYNTALRSLLDPSLGDLELEVPFISDRQNGALKMTHFIVREELLPLFQANLAS